uniref:Uncharacterized protein n=1 Tax=Arundo donax TaxID=35708 RepID=A0A0A8ZVA5_ARUDO
MCFPLPCFFSLDSLFLD